MDIETQNDYLRRAAGGDMTRIASPDEIEIGLTDRWWNVRYVYAMRGDFTPTPEQVERGLMDEDANVRHAWVERGDFIPTYAQIERGLKDSRPLIVKLWLDIIRKLSSDLMMEEKDENSSI